MKIFSDFTIKTSLLTVIAVLMVTIPTYAYADNTPSSSASPTPIAPGLPTTLFFDESTNPTAPPHGSFEGIYVYSPTANLASIDPGTLTSCPIPVASAGDYWVLLTLGGTTLADQVNYWLPNTVPNSASVSVPFGTGGPVAITPINGAKVGTGTPNAAGVFTVASQLTPLAAEWHKVSNVLVQGTQTVVVASAQSDTTTEIGTYGLISCGKEGSFTPSFQSSATFDVIQPVGGEIIPINTSALLIAGLGTTGMWIFPTLGTVAGVGIALYKMRKNN